MRISRVTTYRIRIPFRSVFVHALQRRGVTEAVIVVIESDSGEVGIGEVLPRPYLTGETLESVSRNIPALAQRWLGRTFDGRDEVVSALYEELRLSGRALATFAGWELAILDMAGKVFRFAAGDLLGPISGPELIAGAVIDFGVPTYNLEKHCRLLRLAGRRHIKVKVGLDDDLPRLSLVQEVFGADHPLRLDANGAWTADHAIAMLRRMARFNISSVEQPVPARDLIGMRKVREGTGVAVVADESLCSLEDGQCLAAAQAADVFNIRIAKCGGFLASLRLVNLANEAGLSCQLGTLVGETGILSQAGEIFGRRVKGFEFLEGKLQNNRLLVQDILEVRPVEASTHTGLGITIASNHLNKWTAVPPIVYQARQGAIA
jgi:L-alanine-DL-glutamate epimerase-like enolase superfamily enzyme